MADAATALLLWGVFPLLVLAGLCDWACHRATRIEATSGVKESLVHWLLFAQVGSGIALATFFEITGAVLAWCAFAIAVHEVTVWLELRYTVPRREVRPFEQVVHSFMELLPLVGLALLAVLGWERKGEFVFDLREHVPVTALVIGGAATFVFNIVPLAEETLRCARARMDAGPGPA